MRDRGSSAAAARDECSTTKAVTESATSGAIGKATERWLAEGGVRSCGTTGTEFDHRARGF